MALGNMENEELEYNVNLAQIIGQIMVDINGSVTRRGLDVLESFAQQYMLEKGLKKFGDKGEQATYKEVEQLHKRTCFTPVSIKDMTESERKKAQLALTFLTEKRDGTVKSRTVYNGKNTREWLSREDTSSPTASTEGVMITTTIDAKEGRDMLTADVPNAFIQAKIDKKRGDEKIIMKITGKLVDVLIRLAPEVYSGYVVYEKGRRVIYVEVLRALYGMLISAMLWYKKFRGDLEEIGFEFNPYDPCIANRIVKKKQQTIRFHVDDIMSSHVDPKVNDHFLEWLETKYGQIGEVKSTRGKVHEYLGIKFDFRPKGKVAIDMTKYMGQMVIDFEKKYTLNETANTPAANDLFGNVPESPKLDKEMREDFHTFSAKGLFAAKRGRPDTGTAISVLTTRVRSPSADDWNKLVRYMQYVKRTRNDILTLSADNLHVLKWYVDASFAVHPDFKSHTGGVMTMGEGATQAISIKQKMNTRSSCHSELVATDDVITKILWSKLFMEAQGYRIIANILYQDNKSTILLLNNGKESAGKRSRALNIRYFFANDQIEKKNMEVRYCPTKEMWADPMTKPLQGADFKNMADLLMGRKSVSS